MVHLLSDFEKSIMNFKNRIVLTNFGKEILCLKGTMLIKYEAANF